jgi:hypothetical protein
MGRSARETAPWIFWPIAAVWDLVAFVLSLTGRLVGAVVGLLLLVIGLALSITVILIPIGVPLAIVGFLLVLRSIL